MLSTRYLTEFEILGIDCDIAHLEKLVGLYTEILLSGGTFVDLFKYNRYRELLQKIKPNSHALLGYKPGYVEKEVAAYGSYVTLEEANTITETDNENDYIVGIMPIGLEFTAHYEEGTLTKVYLQTGIEGGLDISDVAMTFLPKSVDAFNEICDTIYGVIYIDTDTYRRKFKFIYEDLKLAVYDILINNTSFVSDLTYRVTNIHIIDLNIFSSRYDVLQYIHDDIEEFKVIDFMLISQADISGYIEYSLYSLNDEYIVDKIVVTYNNLLNDTQYSIKDDKNNYTAKVKEIIWKDTDNCRRPYALIEPVKIHDTIEVSEVNLFALGVVLKYEIVPNSTIEFIYSMVRREAILAYKANRVTMLDT